MGRAPPPPPVAFTFFGRVEVLNRGVGGSKPSLLHHGFSSELELVMVCLMERNNSRIKIF